MINLLPIEEKKRIARDYNFRIFIAYFYAVGACFLIACVLLLPAYFLVILKENLANKKLETLKSLPISEPDKDTIKIIKDVNAKISLIENAEKNKFLVLENAIDKILSKKIPGVKLTAIDYEKDKDRIKSVTLKGIAPDRERLLLFKQMLENDAVFSKVDLPISNFVKGKDIDFSLKVTVS